MIARVRAVVLARVRRDDGTAVIEFVFVAIVVMVPLVYLLVAVAVVQRSQVATAQAAREAGRAFATSPSQSAAPARVGAAVRLALAGQGLKPGDVELRFVRAGATCSSMAVVPSLTAGAQFTVCVTSRVALPAVPSVVAGRGVTVVGRYTVHVDDYRSVTP